MTPRLEIMDSDVLVIGSGIAGLVAAWTVARAGKVPLLVSKAPLGKANNTTLAGGGFTFATGAFDARSHFEKTLKAGRMINDPRLVERFIQQAPAQFELLRQAGLSGNALKTGFSCRSTALIGGPDLTALLVDLCRKAGVGSAENVMITDLICISDRCCGAIGFQKRTGRVFGFRAKAVLLATGGAGAIYEPSDNAPGAMGDGYALALRAGLELMDMEFVQFYPLVHPVSERGGRMVLPPFFADLGRILNRQGEDIKEKYALFERPIATVARDRLAQAIFMELSQGNGVDGALLLDLRKADESKMPLSEDLKNRYRKMLSYDTQPVKIITACHHTMGGIPIDTRGRTGIDGLFAAGEVTGAIHGANRMGGNALSEGLVFGEVCAQSACEFSDRNDLAGGFETAATETAGKRSGCLTGTGAHTASGITALTKQLKRLLWEKVGIVREASEMRSAVSAIDALFDALAAQRAENPMTLAKVFECENAALTGKAVALSALERTESRGAHFRKDFPGEDTKWLKHICVRWENDTLGIGRILPIGG